MEREKKTKSGRLLEVDFYPVFDNGQRLPTRAPKTKRSGEEQAKYNKKQATKKVVRLVNANFETGDNFLHLTYEPSNAPQDEKEARRNMVNYIRQIKRKRESEYKRVCDLLKKNPSDKKIKNLKEKLSQPLRYIYVLEKKTYKTGSLKGRNNWHFHMFLSGGIDRDTLEDMWGKYGKANADRFQPEKFGLEAAAKYITKDPQGAKRFCCSRNLKKPECPPPKDGHITAKGVERLATQRVDDAAYWERRYRGYKFIRCFARYNDYNGHWYVSVVMYKTNTGADLPEWGIDEWIAE